PDARRAVRIGDRRVAERGGHIADRHRIGPVELHEVGLDKDVLVVGARALTGIEGAVTVHVHAEGDAAERGAPIRGVDAVDADPRKTVTPEAAVLPAVQEAVTVCVWRAARDLIAGG